MNHEKTAQAGGLTIQFGGAAGHCPPVQKVINYPSTNIV